MSILPDSMEFMENLKTIHNIRPRLYEMFPTNYTKQDNIKLDGFELIPGGIIIEFHGDTEPIREWVHQTIYDVFGYWPVNDLCPLELMECENPQMIVVKYK